MFILLCVGLGCSHVWRRGPLSPEVIYLANQGFAWLVLLSLDHHFSYLPSPQNHLFLAPPTLQNSELKRTQREQPEAPEPPFPVRRFLEFFKGFTQCYRFTGSYRGAQRQIEVHLLQWNALNWLKLSLLKTTVLLLLWPGQAKCKSQFRVKNVLNFLSCCTNKHLHQQTQKRLRVAETSLLNREVHAQRRRSSISRWWWGRWGPAVFVFSAQGHSFHGVKHCVTVRDRTQEKLED